MIAIGQLDRTRETAELIQRCKAGDQAAWSDMVDRFGRLVYSVARKYGLDEAACEDVFQNVFTILHRRIATISDPAKVSSWLITTTYRECWRSKNAQKQHAELTERQAATREPASEIVQQLEQQQLVREAISRLSERDRRFVSAMFLETGENDYNSLARRTGMPLGSVGPTRARCFKKLRKILLDLGFNPSAEESSPIDFPADSARACASADCVIAA